MGSYYEERQHRWRRSPLYREWAKIFRDAKKKIKSPEWKREMQKRRVRSLAWMKRCHKEGHELAVYDALLFCKEEKIPVPAWVVDVLLDVGMRLARGEKPRKKIGRHASSMERYKQMSFDHSCLTWMEDFREEGMTWERAFEQTGRELNCSAVTARKAYSRAKKRRASGKLYYSELTARQQKLG